LPAKHSTKYPVRRIGFIAAAATLLVVLVAWVAVRAVGPSQDARTPLMVLPSLSAVEEPPFGSIPWTSHGPSAPAPSRTPSHTSVPSRTPSPSAARSSAGAVPKPTEKATTKPAPSRSIPSPTPAATFTARYALGGSWDRGFVAWIQVTNTGAAARSWKVTVTYDAQAGVRVTNAWNAQLGREGETFVLTGGPLAPGATANLGYEATKQVRGKVQPTGCAVNGTLCRQQ
jgi:hypothetical protein